MLYVLDETPALGSSTTDPEHFVAAALAVVERTERSVSCGEWTELSAKIKDVLRLANFAAEVHACTQLWQWEQSGDKRYLDPKLPSFDQAIAYLKKRIAADPNWFLQPGPSSSELFEFVAGVRSRSYRFCPELGAVLLITEIDQPALVEALAQVVFQLCQEQQEVGQADHGQRRFPPFQSHASLMRALESIPGITVTPISGGMNYDVKLV